jgi:hypothetical protein
MRVIYEGVHNSKETYASENLPPPLFAKEGYFLPFAKGGKEGFSLRCLYDYGLINKLLLPFFLDQLP